MAKIKGNSGDNILKGTKFGDKILGLDGDDTIKGRGGNDKLKGGDGDDNINGGKGNDKIFGDDGNDQLKGGSGHDGFYFKFSLDSGKDFIKDFHPGEDTLYISKAFGFDTVQDFLDAGHPSGGDTPFDLSGVGDDNLQIILLGINDPSEIANDVVLIA